MKSLKVCNHSQGGELKEIIAPKGAAKGDLALL